MNSMSWKHKFYDLEKKISSQISELLQLTQAGNCVETTDYAKFKTEHYCKVAKEALELLKQAQNRIEGDRYRIESYMDRVSDLEDQLSQYRLRFNQSQMI
ncbi:hypothetical protein TpMuguga_02g00502 [Theileria parva strain Muguga]|uniref:Uncharacterized protein n=1 Tax=Theileria parva TaxID=5875 RepID=Q4N4Y8_THEPA|nr:uncharacterized protein TpMuguga_02g00502 [Theileria parva strain Muguga]EAN32785.1 hypothetical protein TpMuguga_02g00502 [Theileria parva strain Muguga]|eukprot:XP_765068.1 hypothetical protein [Theileria parva strain Muguga]